MKLFKKKAKTEEINEAEDSQESAALSESDEEAQEPAEPKKSPFRSLKFALICCAGALLIAAALLYVTRFAAVDLLRGAPERSTIQSEENGSFVKYKAFYIIDNYAPEGAKQLYAVVPDSTQFVTVNFTGRYKASVNALIEDTDAQIASGSFERDKYVVVQGTVSELSEEQSAEMYEWFDANMQTLVDKGVIPEGYSAADFLSDKVLLADEIFGMNTTLVLVLTGLALLLVLYVIAELVLMALGFYKEEKPEAEAAEGEQPEQDGQDGQESGMMKTPLKQESGETEDE